MADRYYPGIPTFSMPERLPSPNSSAWTEIVRWLKVGFLTKEELRAQRVNERQLLVIHPAWTLMEEQARAIYNGDVCEGSDGDGNLIPLPKVWYRDFYGRMLFVIELPPWINARSVLLWSGDRDLSVA